MAKEKVFKSVKSGLIQSGSGPQIKLDIGRHEGFTRLMKNEKIENREIKMIR